MRGRRRRRKEGEGEGEWEEEGRMEWRFELLLSILVVLRVAFFLFNL